MGRGESKERLPINMDLDLFISQSLSLPALQTLPLSLPVEASGLQSFISVSREDLLNIFLPLLYYSKQHLHVHGGGVEQSRVLIGVCGPAGSGKSTMASLLATLGNTLHSEDSVLFPSRCATVSGDAYHLPNLELIERNLKSRKGIIETFHATAFANDLDLLKMKSKCQVYQQPPLPPTGPTLGSRSTWVEIDNDNALWFPSYDRAVTHDPVLRSVKIEMNCRVVFIEHLFVARGDGKTPSGDFNPLGPDPQSWMKVLSLLDEVFLLKVPMALCRARCLKRRLVGLIESELDSKLEATAKHYEKNDAKTWREIIEGDISRASIVIEVPLSEEMVASDKDDLQLSPADAINALLRVESSTSFFKRATLKRQ